MSVVVNMEDDIVLQNWRDNPSVYHALETIRVNGLRTYSPWTQYDKLLLRK
jgi:hypothetical protein